MARNMIALYVPDEEVGTVKAAKSAAKASGLSFSAWTIALMKRSVAASRKTDA